MAFTTVVEIIQYLIEGYGNVILHDNVTLMLLLVGAAIYHYVYRSYFIVSV